MKNQISLKDAGISAFSYGWRRGCATQRSSSQFRTLILEQDLVFMTDNGATNITQDEIGNTYDRVGGVYSNFEP